MISGVNDFITTAGNSAITFAFAFGWLLTTVKVIESDKLVDDDLRKLTESARSFAVGLMWVFGGLTIRVGWWVFGLALDDPGDYYNYHQFFTVNKVWMMILATPMIIYGSFKMLRELYSKERDWKYLMIVSSFGIGFLAATIFELIAIGVI